MEKVLDYFSQKSYPLSQLRQSFEYQEFRSQVPLKKISVDEDGNSDKFWSVYDSGPRSVSCPLVCFPPVSGSAEVFFKQVSELSKKGIRIIAVSYPVYWTYREMILGFIRLLDHLRLDRVHIFGASVGGFLAQKIVENCAHCSRVASLILCNSFTDTSIFNQKEMASLFWVVPGKILKRMVMKNSILEDPYFSTDSTIKDSVVFVAESLKDLPQSELASRLTLNCCNGYVEPQRVQSIAITVMDVFDRCALSQRVREDMYKMYPDAKRAHLKTGGNFPYLSRWQEVNMFIEIHLRRFRDTKYSSFEAIEAKVFDNPTLHSSSNKENGSASPSSPPDNHDSLLLDDHDDEQEQEPSIRPRLQFKHNNGEPQESDTLDKTYRNPLDTADEAFEQLDNDHDQVQHPW